MPKRANLLVALLLFRVGGAEARPAGPCRVRVALAPAEVRAEIEAWVRAEPRCERELEVRVVPTRDGALYLSAVDGEGRVRERVVPDAQSAAVLVVSWMADDSLGPTFEERAPVPVAMPPPSPVRVPELDELVPEAATRVEATARRAGARHRSLLLGGFGGRDGGGLRAQVDVLAGPSWALGIAGGKLERGRDDERRYARIVLGASRAVTQRWSLRAQLGIGVEVERAHGGHRDDAMTGRDDEPHVVPSLEVAGFVGARLTDRWGVMAGPVVTVSADRPVLGGFLGLRRGL